MIPGILAGLALKRITTWKVEPSQHDAGCGIVYGAHATILPGTSAGSFRDNVNNTTEDHALSRICQKRMLLNVLMICCCLTLLGFLQLHGIDELR